MSIACRNIVLTGFMGSGKSTIARQLASRLNWRVVDTDELVSQMCGKSVAEIFKCDGVAAFREAERVVLSRALELEEVVISTGGGAVEDCDSRLNLKRAGMVVWLDVSVEVAEERIGLAENRPLLAGLGRDCRRREIDRLLSIRRALYEEVAHLRIDADAEPLRVVSNIMTHLSKMGHQPCECADSLDSTRLPVEVNGSRYDVFSGHGLLAECASLTKSALPKVSRVLLVSNPVVFQLWGSQLTSAATRVGIDVDVALMADGEKHKTLSTAARLYDTLVETGHDRQSAVWALGGGVTGDVAGFVAATYMRGIPVVQLPTTLLAQVDSSIGGKVAVDHSKGKNLIGAFYQPSLVVCDTTTLRTLPRRVYVEGLSEVVKTAVISGPELFEFLEQNVDLLTQRRMSALNHVVRTCARVKADIVCGDEREKGNRTLLNLGHTFGHAIEAALGYSSVSHGEAVALGLCMATYLSWRLGLGSESLHERVRDLLAGFGLKTSLFELDNAPPAALIKQMMQHDKKRQQGRLRFVLPSDLGRLEVRSDIPETLITEAIGQKGVSR